MICFLFLFIIILIFYYFNFEFYYDIDYNNFFNFNNTYYQNNNAIDNIFKHFNSNKCLDIKNNKLILNKCDNSDNQNWEYDNYIFINKKINKCIDNNFNIINCDDVKDKFIKFNYNNGFYYKVYSPEKCIDIDNDNNFKINNCNLNNINNQLFTNIDDMSINNYDDELKIYLYFEILKNYKIFKKDNKYSDEFKNNFNINTFNLYYDFYLKYNDNYTDNDIENLYKNINDINNKYNIIKEEILEKSYEFNLNKIKENKLLNNMEYGSILSSCVNKYNIIIFMNFKNKYNLNFNKDDLLLLYNALLNDKNTDKTCLTNFKKYLDNNK